MLTKGFFYSLALPHTITGQQLVVTALDVPDTIALNHGLGNLFINGQEVHLLSPVLSDTEHYVFDAAIIPSLQSLPLSEVLGGVNLQDPLLTPIHWIYPDAYYRHLWFIIIPTTRYYLPGTEEFLPGTQLLEFFQERLTYL